PESQDFGETVERLKRYQRTLEDLITPREVLQFSVESSSSQSSSAMREKDPIGELRNQVTRTLTSDKG
ncbi:MAG: hypothetical protein K940chlam4_00518, partial [Candidatus Anoxychlamydiales bacterium]|nr:hypothetical protein [Candidatus Anoxychlamydiales bacterium]